MPQDPLFKGLVVDELDQPVQTTVVGDESFYVVDDNGFLRHIEAQYVDRQVMDHLASLIEGHEDLIAEGTMKMLGQEDIFTKAMIERQLEQLDEQFEAMLQVGLPEELRMWLGMIGFQVVVDLHGDVVEVRQPSSPEPPEE